MRIIQSIFAIIGTASLVACNAAPRPQKVDASKTAGDSNYNSDASTKPNDTADETVTPPSQITGSYLICEELGGAAKPPSSADIVCALRYDGSNQLVDLSKDVASYEYGLINQDNGVAVSQVDLKGNPEWHMDYKASGPNPQAILDFKATTKFTLKVVDNSGAKHEFVSGIPAFSMRWQRLDGGRIPANAVVSGSEKNGDPLYLCRGYTQGQIIPGKLAVAQAGRTQSICSTNASGTAEASSDSVTGGFRFSSEVLVIDRGSFNDYWEWVPSVDGGHPVLALLAGLDERILPIYACRVLDKSAGNASAGEKISGQVRFGGEGCDYVAPDGTAKQAKSYEVLSWKSAALKDIFTRTDN